MYLFHNRIRLAKVIQIIESLEGDNWVYITSFVYLEDNTSQHLYPSFRVKMKKNGIIKWIFVDLNGYYQIANEA